MELGRAHLGSSWRQFLINVVVVSPFDLGTVCTVRIVHLFFGQSLTNSEPPTLDEIHGL